jgi:hypothetical protein
MSADNNCCIELPPPIQLLKCLPSEILRRILYGFCDGKSLSTLSLALCVDHMNRYTASRQVPRVCCKKLNDIASMIEKTSAGKEDASQVIGAVRWIRSIAASLDFEEEDREEEIDGEESAVVAALTPSRMRIISENAAVLDYLLVSLRDFSNVEKGQFEWLVWCGQLTIDSFLTGTRMRHSGRVLISSPMQRPTFIPGCGLLKNANHDHNHNQSQLDLPLGLFRCEPYNMVPMPPWGKIHGYESEDNRVLRPVADRLNDTHQVAVPAGNARNRNHNSNMLDIRILAPAQARELLSRRRTTSSGIRTSWMLQQQQHDGVDDDEDLVPLVCCWHDELGELEHDRDYISYVIDLLKVRERLGASIEPLSSACGYS